LWECLTMTTQHSSTSLFLGGGQLFDIEGSVEASTLPMGLFF
jgi:hypothetical protein